MADDDFKKKLTPEQYYVLREKGTETPGSGKYLHHNETGDYVCAACGNVVFKSEAKYDSTTPGLIGWPSFDKTASDNAVKLSGDNSLGMDRTEVTCAKCGSHLGHLFAADDAPTGQHYCINSVALEFNKRS